MAVNMQNEVLCLVDGIFISWQVGVLERLCLNLCHYFKLLKTELRSKFLNVFGEIL